jgi:hypothetical protein
MNRNTFQRRNTIQGRNPDVNRIYPLNKTINSNKKPLTQSIKNKLGQLMDKFPLKENIDSSRIFKTIGIIILICIVIYIGICIYMFYTTDCYEKKSFMNYLFDFDPFNVCIQKDPPIPPKKESEIEPVKLLPLKENKEVFHIANQNYTFEQAKCKCESYGAKLATKHNMVDAYNKGASWCTYGWSEGQNAFYPVQQCDWDSLNKEDDKDDDKEYYHNREHNNNHKKQNKCGKPGLNGGYFPNPDLKFGVNCYGKKPKGENSNKLKDPYCPPMNFCKLDKNYDASHKLDSDEISPFNNEKWSDSGNLLF